MDHSQNVVPASGGEQLMNLGSLVTIKVPAALSDQRYSVLEQCIPPSGGPPQHTHPEAEILYVLTGEFDFSLEGQSTRLGAGGVVNVPPDARHAIKNVGSTAGKLLSIYIPGNTEGFFREAGTPVTGPDQLPDLDQPPDLRGIDRGTVFAIAAKYGMKVFPPS